MKKRSERTKWEESERERRRKENTEIERRWRSSHGKRVAKGRIHKKDERESEKERERQRKVEVRETMRLGIQRGDENR